jgi:excisionase family DNA binding protein
MDTKFRFFSVAEAADFLGVTGGRVRQLLLAGELDGHKLGKSGWAIPENALRRFKVSREKKSGNGKATATPR